VNAVPPETTGPLAAIPAQSERQAMDWSLVLASQEIGVVIAREPATGRWSLQVAEEDQARARDAIHRFRLENRGWAWRQQVPGSELHFHWAALAWVFLLSLIHVLGSSVAQRATLIPSALHQGEWWRVFTATWLHADAGHLAMNALFGALLLGLAMGRYGGGCAGAAALLAGAGANTLAPLIRQQEFIGLGASGVVMAALGLLTAQMAAWWRQSWRATRLILGAVTAGSWLFLELGTSPRGDVLVHALGFGLGLLIGVALALLPDRVTARLQQPAWALTILLAVLPWVFALR
jgi:membrane associated rhomboid family serine protease